MILLPVVFLLDFQEWRQIGERALGTASPPTPACRRRLMPSRALPSPAFKGGTDIRSLFSNERPLPKIGNSKGAGFFMASFLLVGQELIISNERSIELTVFRNTVDSIIMVLIFGTRLNRSTVGFVAEECPGCRAPAVCRLIELSRGDHLFFIPMGRGAFPLGHEARCLTCRSAFEVTALDYHNFGSSKKMTVGELIPLTSPWLGNHGTAEAGEELRFRNILKVFTGHDASLRTRRLSGGLQFDWVGGLAILAMVFIPLVLIGLVMSEQVPFLSQSQAVVMATVGSFAALIWGFYLISTEDRRFFRKHTLRRLHAELDPLNPQRQDWEKAIFRLKRLRFPIWKMLKPELRYFDSGMPPASTERGPSGVQSVWQPPQATLRVR